MARPASTNDDSFSGVSAVQRAWGTSGRLEPHRYGIETTDEFWGPFWSPEPAAALARRGPAELYRLGAKWNIICMAAGGSFVSTPDAARALGVTVQHVRRLADSGDLVRVARGLIDRDSLESYIAGRHGGRTRVWSEHTAWAAVAMLSGVYVDWLGPTQASRLRASLRAITDPADLVTQTRDRASLKTYQGHPSALRRLLDELVTVDTTGLGLVGATTDSVDGYLGVDSLDSAVGFFGLQADPTGNVTLRATRFDLGVVRDLAVHGMVLAALDAAASRDPRERGAGERALADALDRFRR